MAHPGLVPIAMEIFNEYMPGPNQVDKPLDSGPAVTAANLVEIPEGAKTDEAFRRNIEISLLYLESWLRGTGCVPIFNLMEDAATAEISRAQLWQWNRYGTKTDDGKVVDTARIRIDLAEILAKKKADVGEKAYAVSKFDRAGELLMNFTAGPFRSFLTTDLYNELG